MVLVLSRRSPTWQVTACASRAVLRHVLSTAMALVWSCMYLSLSISLEGCCFLSDGSAQQQMVIQPQVLPDVYSTCIACAECGTHISQVLKA